MCFKFYKEFLRVEEKFERFEWKMFAEIIIEKLTFLWVVSSTWWKNFNEKTFRPNPQLNPHN